MVTFDNIALVGSRFGICGLCLLYLVAHDKPDTDAPKYPLKSGVKEPADLRTDPRLILLDEDATTNPPPHHQAKVGTRAVISQLCRGILSIWTKI